ncbi:MAG TPA: hypothetical protein PK821_06580 [Victivallales bacterium]|nr:hypothetical protein [Victivallales bacterium]
MKKLYIFGNILLLLTTLLLSYFNLSFKKSPPDPLIGKTTEVSSIVSAQPKSQSRKDKTQNFSPLWDDNLFSPYRMKDEGEGFPSLNVSGLELIGICKYGDVSGAIILDKSSSQNAANPRLPNPLIPQRGKPGVAKGELPQFYKQDDSLANGFVVREIQQDSVLLTRGREQVTLPIEFEDSESMSRAEAAFKIEKEKTIEAAKLTAKEVPPQVQPNTANLPPFVPGTSPEAAPGAITPGNANPVVPNVNQQRRKPKTKPKAGNTDETQ